MSVLFSPFTIRGVTFANRIAVSPMSQYRARDGVANDWHLVHLGRFAMGGAGLVYAEATGVTRDGRRTHGDLGLWDDAQIEKLAPIAAFLEAEGAVPGIQLGHAGRKASEKRPWDGETPVDAADAAKGEPPWPALAPSALPYADGWPAPKAMTARQIDEVIKAFGAATRRAVAAGFKVVEIYAAHGFLIHQFLSPLANKRRDKWGGSPENRRRFAVAVAREVRKNLPDDHVLAFRLSATDWVDGGIEIGETVDTAIALKAEGVDMIDASSGGIGGKERPRRMTLAPGFQAPFAAEIRRRAGIPAMAVGFIWEPEACEDLLAEGEVGEVDMIALGRELLENPNWPLHAAAKLGVDRNRSLWPVEMGWWLGKRDRLIAKLGLRRSV